MLSYTPDMKHWLSPFDLIYEKAPIEWEAGIPLANGDIGALIWGDGNPLKITLDKYDAWELRFPAPTDPRYNCCALTGIGSNHRIFNSGWRIISSTPRRCVADS